MAFIWVVSTAQFIPQASFMCFSSCPSRPSIVPNCPSKCAVLRQPLVREHPPHQLHGAAVRGWSDRRGSVHSGCVVERPGQQRQHDPQPPMRVWLLSSVRWTGAQCLCHLVSSCSNCGHKSSVQLPCRPTQPIALKLLSVAGDRWIACILLSFAHVWPGVDPFK